MTTVGMLSHRKDPKTVYRSYAYAAAAKMEGVGFVFFSPGEVNFSEKTIYGWMYEKGEWLQRKVPFPDVIFNTSSAMTDKQEAVIDQLNQEIPFTSHAVGDKISVYNRIMEDKVFANYLIPSLEVTHPQEVTDLLNSYSELIVKPLSGSKGNDVVYIRKDQSDYSVVENGVEQVMVKNKIEGFLKGLTMNATFLAQPYIRSRTKSGLAYDFRLHTQKDGEGQWTLTTIYPRIAAQGVVANMSQGGYTAIFDDFLKQEFEAAYYNVKRNLEQFAIQFSHRFDGLYDVPLDELGIDVGLDSNCKIWIFEVNWRPGAPALFYLESDVTKNMIRYACYLHHQKKGSFSNESI